MANTPKIRFKGFTDDWEQRKLGDLMDVTSVKRIHQSDWTESGIRFLRARDIVAESKNEQVTEPLFISEKKYEEYSSLSGKVKPGDLLVTGVGTIGVPMLINTEEPLYFKDGNIIWFKNENTIDGRFFYHSFNGTSIQKFIKESAGIGTVGTYTIDSGKKTPINLPTQKAEQIKIGEFFDGLDNLITLHQRKCDETKELKKYMLQKMFPKNGEKKPEIRFSGFTDDWEQRKVSEVAEIVAGGTPSTKISSYWEPKEVPWLSSGEVHKKFITFTDNMISQEGMNNSSAKMIKENSVLIALAGQGKTRGTVAINRIPLTTNQSIAAMTFNDDIVPEFVFCNLENRYDEIRKMSSGDGARGGLNKQLVGDIEIPYTSFEEQKKIGTYFEQLDNLVTLHQRKCDELVELKKYMLQNMFPQKG